MGSCYSCLKSENESLLTDENNSLDLNVHDRFKVPNYRLKCLALGECNVQFLSKILQWKTEWFHEDYKTKPNYSSILHPEYLLVEISETYNNWDDYRKTMEPLIVLKCYENLLEGENNDSTFPLCGNIRNYQTKILNGKKFIEFTIKKIIKTGDEYYLPKLGDLLTIKFKNQIEIFGYLENIQRDTIQINMRGPSIYECLFTVIIQDLNILPNKEIKLTSKKSICIYLKMLQALHDLSNSPHCSLILQPDHIGYKIYEAQIGTVQPLLFDQRYSKIVTGVAKTIENSRPHISLIQGPPGSGKSTIITSIITEIIMKIKNNTKILLCTQTNKAVNGVLLKLLCVKSVLRKKGINLNVIRIFCDDEKDPNVRILSLTKGADGTLKGMPIPFILTGKDFYIHKNEEQILTHADVIVSTFSSCYTNKMEYIYGKNGIKKISVCIVDNAEESSELLNLIPLMFDVKTLILVGNSEQPPSTVTSEETEAQGMDISLFTRVQKYYHNRPFMTSPIITLNM